MVDREEVNPARIVRVAPSRQGVVWIEFDDGLAGEYDLRLDAADAPLLAPMRDASYFASVSVGSRGRSFGWTLDAVGSEIDFCADAARMAIETRATALLAERHTQHAAE